MSIETTLVGSYPVPSWLQTHPTEQGLDAASGSCPARSPTARSDRWSAAATSIWDEEPAEVDRAATLAVTEDEVTRLAAATQRRRKLITLEAG